VSYGDSYELDEELEEIRRRKAAELQRKLAEEEERKRAAALEAQKQAVLRAILTPEARQRLTNVKLVNPQLAAFVENQLIALAQAGRIAAPITDEELKQILAELSTRVRREYRITFKEK